MGVCESCLLDEDDSPQITAGSSTSFGGLSVGGGRREKAFADVPPEFQQMYKVGPLLGYGTTSKVYAIKERTNNRALACKVIDKRKLSLDRHYEVILHQLRAEIGILRRLEHENIVSFRDVIETRNTIYIITEYVSGGELFHHIVENGPLQEQEAKMVMKGIFSAVSYLHELGIIHRDIKAENILISRKEGRIVSVKVIDFGFSKILRCDLAGSFLGTSGYIAPEIRQQKQYSRSVDMWACGVLLYAILSGRLPFSPVTDILPSRLGGQDVKEFEIEFLPVHTWSSLSPSVKDLVTGLLNVDPMKRITTREAVIHPWMDDEKIEISGIRSPNRSPYRGMALESNVNNDHETLHQLNLHQSSSMGALHYVRTPPSSRMGLSDYYKNYKDAAANLVATNEVVGEAATAPLPRKVDKLEGSNCGNDKDQVCNDKNGVNYSHNENDDYHFKMLDSKMKAGSDYTESTDSSTSSEPGNEHYQERHSISPFVQE